MVEAPGARAGLIRFIPLVEGVASPSMVENAKANCIRCSATMIRPTRIEGGRNQFGDIQKPRQLETPKLYTAEQAIRKGDFF